jgi:hypothetical protein
MHAWRKEPGRSNGTTTLTFQRTRITRLFKQRKFKNAFLRRFLPRVRIIAANPGFENLCKHTEIYTASKGGALLLL